ncbi:MAG TPA: DUF2121 domain-containing protein [Methanotrichaceae archaeon]|nr:DUF2121 domain-containing protein [Methanotrichaceae archaeon]
MVAFAGSREAIIGGDKRSITFLGSCPDLEEELYSGKIKDDEELVARAKELGASLQVSDGREKVWKRRLEEGEGDLLVGEVTEISLNSDRRRRIYLAPGAYLMAEIAGGEAKISGQGKVGCIVLGNKLTQRLAGEAIKKAGGRMNEEIMRSIFADAGSGSRTASVSREYTVLRTEVKLPDPAAALLDAFKEDCKNSGWKPCGQCSRCGQQPCDRQ